MKKLITLYHKVPADAIAGNTLYAAYPTIVEAFMATEIYRDQYSEYFDDPDHHVLELRWLDTTRMMSEAQFRAGLDRLATMLEERHTPNVIIDVVNFDHQSPDDFGAWREKNIIPRYNAAGVKKFAFVMPASSTYCTEMGVEPAVEGSARFPTGYFRTPEHAIAWFASGS
jgi:hypothetical protein